MKKKLLSLVLAGAMVASTSVSAFAQDKVISGADTTEPTTNITITGQVLDELGNAPAGTFKVTVPTVTNFTVNKKKELVSPEITISNGGTQSVDIYAYEFTDPTVDENITVLGTGQLSDKDRTNVSLNIKGNKGTAYLGSALGNNKNGIYSKADLSVNANKDGLLLSTIQPDDSDKLRLSGEVGQDEQEINKAVSDDFTLVLKIKKTTENK